LIVIASIAGEARVRLVVGFTCEQVGFHFVVTLKYHMKSSLHTTLAADRVRRFNCSTVVYVSLPIPTT